MGYDPEGTWNWKNFWIGAAITAIAVVGVALALPTGGASLSATSAVILLATASTGAVMTYAAAEEKTAVIDLSCSVSNGTDSISAGFSLVVDFDKGGIELYSHVGKAKGCSMGVTYSTGIIENYGGIGSYSGLFFQGGAAYYLGINHCFDPENDYKNTIKATTLTFSTSGASYGVGMDYYFAPIVIKRPK